MLFRSAADKGDLDSIRQLVRAKPTLVNLVDPDDHTPLHVATSSGQRRAVEMLVNAGAKLEARDNCGWTPLHTAAARGDRAIVELLVKRGAELNATDRQGQTPLRHATKRGFTELAEWLRSQGARE